MLHTYHKHNGITQLVHLGGWRRQHQDSRDEGYRLRASPLFSLPSGVDSRPLCSPIEDQGDEGSCTANALAGCVELNEHAKWAKLAALDASILPSVTTSGITVASDGTISFQTAVKPVAQPKPPPPPPPPPAPTAMRVSRAFEYYMARSIEGTTSEDSGATVRDAIQAGVLYGLLDEALMPYVAGQYTTAPTSAQKASAAQRKIKSYHAIADGDLAAMKTALAAGFAVDFGFQCYDYMLGSQMATTGILKMPAAGESLQGGHSVCIVGYIDSTQMVICRNSWGINWGQAGYFLMPYAYVSTPRLASDFWVIQS